MMLGEVIIAGPLLIPVIAIAAVGALGAGVTAYGNYQQAKAESRGLEAQARVERQNAYARERAARRAGTLAVRRQQLAVASSGLLLEGSPLEQLARNTFEVEYQALQERNAGLNRAAYLRWQGHTAKQTARRAIVTSTLLGALSGAAQGVASFGGGGAATATKAAGQTAAKSATKSGAGLLAVGGP